MNALNDRFIMSNGGLKGGQRLLNSSIVEKVSLSVTAL